MPTPHNAAHPGDFAKTVLMPGDPLRSRFIAETYLTEAKLVNNIRGVHGYTGFYQGVPVSVMASGMGMPSMGIYSHELFSEYDVDNIIRIGSAGAIHEKLQLRDLVAGLGCCTDSNFAAQFELPGTFCPVCSYELLETAMCCAEKLGQKLTVGTLLTSDRFYDAANSNLQWRRMGVLAVEMETAALYCNAAYFGKRALTLCTISDHIATGEALDAEARQLSLTAMIEVALHTAVALEEKGK